MHVRRRLRSRLGIVAALLFAALVPAAARATHLTPTAITFTIEHGDCDGAGANSFALYLNGTLLATVPSTQGCACNASPLVATFTDAATLALFDPAACNSFRVDVTGGGLLVAPDDPSALADGLRKLWQDRSLAQSLGERGARGVRTHYSIARSADRLLDVYEALVDRPLEGHVSAAASR